MDSKPVFGSQGGPRENMREILLTTEAYPPFPVSDRLGIVTAECVFGMNAFRDFFVGMTDMFGGRSSASQKVFRDARTKVLEELRKEAAWLGANAVIAVSLAYNEISGKGNQMLFVVATGTAVIADRGPRWLEEQEKMAAEAEAREKAAGELPPEQLLSIVKYTGFDREKRQDAKEKLLHLYPESPQAKKAEKIAL